MIFSHLAQPFIDCFDEDQNLRVPLIEDKKERVIFLTSKTSQNDQKHREGVNAQASIHI